MFRVDGWCVDYNYHCSDGQYMFLLLSYANRYTTGVEKIQEFLLKDRHVRYTMDDV